MKLNFLKLFFFKLFISPNDHQQSVGMVGLGGLSCCSPLRHRSIEAPSRDTSSPATRKKRKTARCIHRHTHRVCNYMMNVHRSPSDVVLYTSMNDTFLFLLFYNFVGGTYNPSGVIASSKNSYSLLCYCDVYTSILHIV